MDIFEVCGKSQQPSKSSVFYLVRQISADKHGIMWILWGKQIDDRVLCIASIDVSFRRYNNIVHVM